MPDNMFPADEPDTDKDDGANVSFILAGLDSRAIAFFIDLVLVSLIALSAFGLGIKFLDGSNIDSLSLRRIFMPVYLLLFFLASAYFVILNGYCGKTIGKMLFGIRIVSEQGGTIGFWQSFVRWIGYYISASLLFLGFVWSLFDASSQSWHDKIAGTFVVKD